MVAQMLIPHSFLYIRFCVWGGYELSIKSFIVLTLNVSF